MQEELVDRIYECSVLPQAWPSVLDEVAQLAGSTGGLLFSARKALHWTASDRVADVFSAYVEEGWFGKCSRRLCLMGQETPSFFVEHDFWSDDELDADPVYRDFFRPRGLGWSAGTGVQVPTGDNIVFSVERAFRDGPIEPERVAQLNLLRPHLARSALVSARLQHRAAQGAAEALAALKLPAFLLRMDGQVAEASPQTKEIESFVLWGANGRFRLNDRQADRLLNDALAEAPAGSEQGARSFPVRDTFGMPQLVAHLIPVRRAAHDVFGDSYALLLLIPVTSERAPSISLLKSLFDLTPSEARVASGIARGDTPEDIAAAGGVAISTIRTQLRRTLEKTGTARQADLAGLLGRIGATAPD
ncbi:MAG: helix-turn-helix transcriptional regulator [Sphingopyxis sp.]|uniref:helix-turn-helix transcriptional regulator n=1 Tax=Sphingopyxis sp. TaxID=1908224 RepID=UPI002AB9883F|nr:helix-turn-helix transcriptional regulator [Sphingopyxis sp.]MDZ3833320.1 helix-turn-helix transcriptional regulator [Sphingopyxis sp.]